MNPGFVAELKAAKNVRGWVPVGDGTTQPLYVVILSNAAYSRAQELTNMGALPLHTVWFTWEATPGRVEVHTNRPEWFVELEEMIDASRRQPYR